MKWNDRWIAGMAALVFFDRDVIGVLPFFPAQTVYRMSQDEQVRAVEQAIAARAHAIAALQRKALDIVKRHVIDKGYMLHGGAAINMCLPNDMKIYSEEQGVDYDVFVPGDADNNKRAARAVYVELDRAGYSSKYIVALHKTTQKVFAVPPDATPAQAKSFPEVLDMTAVPKASFAALLELSKAEARLRPRADRAFTVAPTAYVKLSLHLEFSRPQGHVERWRKLYPRMVLVYHCFPRVETWAAPKSSRGSDYKKSGSKASSVNILKPASVDSLKRGMSGLQRLDPGLELHVVRQESSPKGGAAASIGSTEAASVARDAEVLLRAARDRGWIIVGEAACNMIADRGKRSLPPTAKRDAQRVEVMPGGGHASLGGDAGDGGDADYYVDVQNFSGPEKTRAKKGSKRASSAAAKGAAAASTAAKSAAAKSAAAKGAAAKGVGALYDATGHARAAGTIELVVDNIKVAKEVVRTLLAGVESRDADETLVMPGRTAFWRAGRSSSRQAGRGNPFCVLYSAVKDNFAFCHSYNEWAPSAEGSRRGLSSASARVGSPDLVLRFLYAAYIESRGEAISGGDHTRVNRGRAAYYAELADDLCAHLAGCTNEGLCRRFICDCV